jgi:maltose-binding protein MalE
MKTRHLLLLLAISLLTAACGQGIDNALAGTTTSTSTTSTSTTSTTVTATTLPTQETTTTTEAPPPDPIIVWVQPDRADGIAGAAEDFEAATGIPVEIVPTPLVEIRDAVLDPRDGTAPDVFSGSHRWLGELIAAGAITETGLDARVGEFTEVAAEAFTADGVLWGAPYAVDATVLFYDPNRIPDPPTGFSALKSVCDELDDIDECLLIPVDDPANTWPFLSAQGGYLFGETDGAVDVADVGVDSEGALAGAAFLRDVDSDGYAEEVGSLRDAADAFAAGDVPMLFGGIATARALSGSVTPVETTVLPVMGGATPVSWVTGVGFYLSSGSEQPDQAATLLREFLVTTSAMTDIYNTRPAPPAYLAVAEASPAAEEMAAYLASAEGGEPIQAVPEINQVLAVLRPSLAALHDRTSDQADVLGTAADAIRAIVGDAPADDGSGDDAGDGDGGDS